MARISRTGTTDSTGVASTTVTGTGGGRLKFISRNGGLWSNSKEIEDLIWFDNFTSDTLGEYMNGRVNTVYNDGIEVTITGASPYVRIRQNYLPLSQVKGKRIHFEYTVEKPSNKNIQATIYKEINGSYVATSSQYTTENTVSLEFDVGEEVTNIIFQMTLTNFSNGESLKIKEVKVYPVFTAPKHYTPIELSSSASIIQTGETATLSAELTNVLGEKLANKSVNFIEKVEHLYENTSEVSQVYNSGQNVTVLSPSISRSDLGTNWTLSFDMKTDCESRVFIGNSASAVPTNPQYSIFMGRDVSNVISYGFRTTSTTVSASSVASTSYHSCKIVFNNGTITYYVDDTQVGTKSVSFYGNYDNYVVGLVAWGSGTLYVKNIVLENGEDILIGTGTTNSQGIATCNVTGTGKGERQFIASNSSILSEIYEVTDCIVKDGGITSNKTFNKSLNDDDFYLEFTVHPTTTDSSVARLLIRQDSTQYLNIGDLYSNANCGLQWSYGGVTSSFYGKGIYVDVDTKVTLTRTGTSMVLTVGDSTYNISNCPLTFNNLEMAIVSNNSINDLKVYTI